MPMEITRLQHYDRSSLSSLPVSGAEGLRTLIRKEVEAGNITGLTGTAIIGLGKEQCINLLLGDSETGVEATPPPVSTPYVPPAASSGPADAAAQMMQLFSKLASGVDPQEIARQVNAAIAPHLAVLQEINASASTAMEATGHQMEAFLSKCREEIDHLRAEMMAGKPVSIEVRPPNGEVKQMGRQHYLFPLVLKLAEARVHAYIVGPAGSGKTTLAHRAADALGLPFYATSVCQQTTKSDLLGFIVPGNGEYHATDFRRAYEHGGVFVLDEIDNGNANVIAVLNAALANGQMGFPDGMVLRHPDFVLIACANTFGTGADRLYVGRNQLDAASLDRFAFVEFPYDEGFEAHLAGCEGRPSPVLDLCEGGSVTCDGWLDTVARIRHAVASSGQRAVVSPRATFYGKALAEVGIGREWLERMLIWKGMDENARSKVRAALD